MNKLESVPSQGNIFLVNPFYLYLANQILWQVCELLPGHQKTNKRLFFLFHFMFRNEAEACVLKHLNHFANIELQLPSLRSRVGIAVA